MMPPRFLPLQWRLWLTARPTAPHHAGSSPVSGWFLRAATAAADAAEPLRDVASGARARRCATRPPRRARPRQIRPSPRAPSSASPVPSAGHDGDPGRWSGHVPGLPGAFARHPSLPRLECRVGNRGTPPSMTTGETEDARHFLHPLSFRGRGTPPRFPARTPRVRTRACPPPPTPMPRSGSARLRRLGGIGGFVGVGSRRRAADRTRGRAANGT